MTLLVESRVIKVGKPTFVMIVVFLFSNKSVNCCAFVAQILILLLVVII